ncbi:MAG: hypothetical protein MI923_00775 [Phycisphaerales bacterium]|nr:hypothetical protein [Phycisphaerales bacterium]
MTTRFLTVSVISIAFTWTLAQAGAPTQLLLTNTEADGLPAGIKSLDLNNGAILGFLVQEDFPNNGNLWPVDAMAPGPDRTILVAQATDDKIRQYDEFGSFVGQFVSGEAVNNIRGIVRSPDGNFLFTSDWADDNIHRFNFFTGAPAPSAGDPDGEFIIGMQSPPRLDLPQAMAILSTGELLVADIGQVRLIKFNATTGAVIGPFVPNPLEDINGATVRDIDVLANGDVVVTVSGSGNTVRTYSSAGALDGTRTFPFNSPNGVHVLPTGDYLVTSGSTFGQGKGLFRVNPSNGAILQTIDNSRSYGALELITLVDAAPSCGGMGDGDVDQNGSVDGRDVASFVDLLVNGSGSPADPDFCAADLDGDDDVTFLDVDPFVQALLGS